jgi:hypothetical protein
MLSAGCRHAASVAPILGGAANLEYSASLYAGLIVRDQHTPGIVLPYCAPRWRTVRHDGVHLESVAYPPTHARAVCGGRFWPPPRPSTLRSRDVVTSPGPTPCAVILPMPCAVTLVVIHSTLIANLMSDAGARAFSFPFSPCAASKVYTVWLDAMCSHLPDAMSRHSRPWPEPPLAMWIHERSRLQSEAHAC